MAKPMKKKYPYMDTSKMKKSNVDVNVVKDPNVYNPPEGLMEKVKGLSNPPQDTNTPAKELPRSKAVMMTGSGETSDEELKMKGAKRVVPRKKK